MKIEKHGAWQPIILNSAHPEDAAELKALREKGLIWCEHNTIRQQLTDLVKTRNPHIKDVITELEIELEIGHIVAEDGLHIDELDLFGRWIYYPWSGVLVHLLPPGLYAELRLNRNQYKITPEEQQRLSEITVGIVGLSVGNAVALTLALEGVGGRLKLADFDELDLSNMNRVRACVADVGLSKAILTARQIFEINPYAQITLFKEGLTPANIDQFFTSEPKLDVVIDECDGFRMKIMLREWAKKQRIPCLMETSERGMVDVERFDLEPSRPLLHGLLGKTTSADIGDKLTSDERIKIALDVADYKNFSSRAAASMIEIGQTISTWPQLASSVVHGGASMTVAVRRLALGQALPSGRRYIDLEQLLSTQDAVDQPGQLVSSTGNLMSNQPRREFPDFIRFVVEHAALAPSGGNCQPWRFQYDDRHLWVLHDHVRSKNLMDPQHHGAYLALGAAIENIVLAAEFKGYDTKIEPFPQADNPLIVARLTFVNRGELIIGQAPPLFNEIKTRITNRKRIAYSPLEMEDKLALVAAAASQQCQLHLLTTRPERIEIGNLLGEGDRIRFLNPGLHQEMMSEVRWTAEEAARTRNGIGLPELELSTGQVAAMQLIARSDVAAQLQQIGGGQRLEEGTRDAIIDASAVALLTVDGHSPADWLRAGRGIEQVWLQATALGLAMQPMTATLYLFNMPHEKQLECFSEEERSQLALLKQRFNRLFPAAANKSQAMVFRLSKGAGQTVRSLRYKLEDILEYTPVL